MGSVDPEQQLTAAQKAGFEAVFSVFTRAFEDTEKLVMAAVRTRHYTAASRFAARAFPNIFT